MGRWLAELDPDGDWIRGTPAGRDLSAEEARTLAAVALHGLGALPPATALAEAVRGPRPDRRHRVRRRVRLQAPANRATAAGPRSP
ncbi:hypothetical protein ACFXKW_08605 [Streptomyces sp. NPDC059193]|uniref:hypothetical protein n=1 Tax=Streptomyces sp. NPDC059193 TaxID=3346763 RepID=UPI0036A424F3